MFFSACNIIDEKEKRNLFYYNFAYNPKWFTPTSRFEHTFKYMTISTLLKN